jgi:hypothetical protein
MRGRGGEREGGRKGERERKREEKDGTTSKVQQKEKLKQISS